MSRRVTLLLLALLVCWLSACAALHPDDPRRPAAEAAAAASFPGTVATLELVREAARARSSPLAIAVDAAVTAIIVGLGALTLHARNRAHRLATALAVLENGNGKTPAPGLAAAPCAAPAGATPTPNGQATHQLETPGGNAPPTLPSPHRMGSGPACAAAAAGRWPQAG